MSNPDRNARLITAAGVVIIIGAFVASLAGGSTAKAVHDGIAMLGFLAMAFLGLPAHVPKGDDLVRRVFAVVAGLFAAIIITS